MASLAHIEASAAQKPAEIAETNPIIANSGFGFARKEINT